MSWSFQVENGDFKLDGGKYATVGGAQKLEQDLAIELLSPRGHDRMHPEQGSTINGGMLDDGTMVSGILGETNWQLAMMRIEQEVRKVVTDIQARQTQRALNDAYAFGKSTLSDSEVAVTISDFQIYQVQDGAFVFVNVVTRDKQTINLKVPVGF